MSTTLTWLGHGAWLIDADGQRVVIDPFFSGNPAASIQAADVVADFLLISHGHGDHVGDVVEIAQNTGALVISNPEIAEWLKTKGLDHLHAMNIGGGRDFPFGHLQMTIAHHSSMLPDGADGGNPAGFLFRLADGRRIYFAADTGLFSDMGLIGQLGIDLAILPIGDNYTMGPDESLRAIRLLSPTRVMPSHYNTWPIIEQDPAAWAARVEAETSALPVVLTAGQEYDWST